MNKHERFHAMFRPNRLLVLSIITNTYLNDMNGLTQVFKTHIPALLRLSRISWFCCKQTNGSIHPTKRGDERICKQRHTVVLQTISKMAHGLFSHTT